MTKSIDTLIDDIYHVLSHPQEYDWPEEELSTLLRERASRSRVPVSGQALRLSQIGQPDRKLWYTEHMPEKGERIPAHALLKFLYGDITEELVLYLAKVSGHTVEAEQETVVLNGVEGHIDAIIDGVLVDVKSANSRGFFKFKNHSLESEDPFGYLDQLNAYLEALQNDERLKVKDKAAFIAVDKELGHLVLDVYKRNNKSYSDEINRKRVVLDNHEPPSRCYAPVEDGKSGNLKLSMPCSYCPYKRVCWPSLRSFAYSNGVRHLVKVVREPDVMEITYDVD